MGIFKLLSVNDPESDVTNIGDYIQALASSQFLPSIDGFVDREKLDAYNQESCNVIMNGWYMHNGKNWPPSSMINPLYVSIHINSQVEDDMLSDKSIEYFKQYAPIGCRDVRTRDLLIQHGVDAYFSGCMTLTLGQSYKSTEKDSSIYFVDVPLTQEKSLHNAIRLLCTFMIHSVDILKISKKFYSYENKLTRLYKTIVFYQEYSKLFSRQILLDAKYICQQSKHWKVDFPTDKERLAEAEKLIKCYSKAKFVVTSRIHCALPCLGIETPVIYVDQFQNDHVNNCRLSGLQELFNVIEWQNGKLKHHFKKKIEKETLLKNKDSWRPLADALIRTCRLWVEECK